MPITKMTTAKTFAPADKILKIFTFGTLRFDSFLSFYSFNGFPLFSQNLLPSYSFPRTKFFLDSTFIKIQDFGFPREGPNYGFKSKSTHLQQLGDFFNSLRLPLKYSPPVQGMTKNDFLVLKSEKNLSAPGPVF